MLSRILFLKSQRLFFLVFLSLFLSLFFCGVVFIKAEAYEKIMGAPSHPFIGKDIALPPGHSLSFLITRKGKKIGYQHIDFELQNNGSLKVSIHIDIRVKLSFITIYDFLHDNTEIWKEGNLQSLNSRTLRDGKSLNLSVKRVEGMLVIDNGEHEDIRAGSLKPSSYWYADFTLQERAIDTVTGKVLELTALYEGVEETATGEETHYFTLNKDIPADIIYSDMGHWVGFKFGKSRHVRYNRARLEDLPPRHKWRVFD